MFQLFLPFTESVKVPQHVPFSKWLTVYPVVNLRLECWCLSTVRQVLHYHKYCQMPSAAQWLYSLFPPARIFVQIKHCSDSSSAGQTARPNTWVIAAAEAFYVSQFWPRWKSTCFYKSSPLRNTCTEQQAHCFPLSYVVKIERRARQHQAGLLNHSSFLAPLGWLKSSCQKHFIMSDMGLEIRLVSTTILLHMETTI